jgi:RNA polymerase sigma-70 factor (ECF subfamily)
MAMFGKTFDASGVQADAHRAEWTTPRSGDARTSSARSRFEAAVLPHLDAAYTLARYLMRDRHDAEDAVQDAVLRALRHFDGFRGEDGRTWLLAIVRNACHTLLHRRGRDARATEFDETMHSDAVDADDPETAALRGATRESVQRALDRLPDEFREVIVLRELQGLSYKEISAVAGVPIGTVMSRLARARQRLQHTLGPDLEEIR